jgi:hypothetical protein
VYGDGSIAELAVVEEFVRLLERSGGDDFVGIRRISCDGADEVMDGGDDVRREGPNYVQIAVITCEGNPASRVKPAHWILFPKRRQ